MSNRSFSHYPFSNLDRGLETTVRDMDGTLLDMDGYEEGMRCIPESTHADCDCLDEDQECQCNSWSILQSSRAQAFDAADEDIPWFRPLESLVATVPVEHHSQRTTLQPRAVRWTFKDTTSFGAKFMDESNAAMQGLQVPNLEERTVESTHASLPYTATPRPQQFGATSSITPPPFRPRFTRPQAVVDSEPTDNLCIPELLSKRSY